MPEGPNRSFYRRALPHPRAAIITLPGAAACLALGACGFDDVRVGLVPMTDDNRMGQYQVSTESDRIERGSLTTTVWERPPEWDEKQPGEDEPRSQKTTSPVPRREVKSEPPPE